MKVFLAILTVCAVMASAHASAGRDFACGEAVGFLVLPRDQIKICLAEHRRELDKPCHDRVIEHEEFMCGIEVEHFVASTMKTKPLFMSVLKHTAKN